MGRPFLFSPVYAGDRRGGILEARGAALTRMTDVADTTGRILE